MILNKFYIFVAETFLNVLTLTSEGVRNALGETTSLTNTKPFTPSQKWKVFLIPSIQNWLLCRSWVVAPHSILARVREFRELHRGYPPGRGSGFTSGSQRHGLRARQGLLIFERITTPFRDWYIKTSLGLA